MEKTTKKKDNVVMSFVMKLMNNSPGMLLLNPFER